MIPLPVPLPVPTVPAGAVPVRDVYLKRFREASANLRAELRIATPEWAGQVLDTLNTHNRKLSGTWLKLRAAIERDAWHVVGVIAFDRDGRLIDGQHRLTAIRAAGVPVPVIVLYGLDPDAFAVLDTGKKRGGADVLSIEGQACPDTLAGALAWQWRYESGEILSGNATPLPNDMILGVLAGHPEMPESVAWARATGSRTVPASLLAFVHYQLAGISPDDAATFFDRVINGVGVAKDSHEFLLRRRLDGLIGFRRSADYVEIAALIFKTWTRVRLQEPVGTLLTWKQDEPFPEII